MRFPNEIMKLPKLLTRKKLRAATARRSLGVPDEMDYEEMSEPNMKLSRALLIVLVLHVVAVAGIIAFNAIKSRQGPLPPVSNTSGNANATQTVTAKTNPPTVASSDAASTRTVTKPVVKEEKKVERPKTDSSIPKAEAAKTYVVAKGDNPVAIARKFKIPYDQLLAANNIEDPHKLRIGQKLIIPTKAAKPKKSAD
ncbi:MAG: LysM domain [Verrucomicrobiota bacterium]|jgi:LysM repeat protein